MPGWAPAEPSPGWDGLASGDGLLVTGGILRMPKVWGLWEWPAGVFLVWGPNAGSWASAALTEAR